uniref:Uncharacterized protein n=1 Tax=Anguilla anguilla TaxID=7936 RepID=A0A0E9QFA8_ANGAN
MLFSTIFFSYFSFFLISVSLLLLLIIFCDNCLVSLLLSGKVPCTIPSGLCYFSAHFFSP